MQEHTDNFPAKRPEESVSYALDCLRLACLCLLVECVSDDNAAENPYMGVDYGVKSPIA